jgi:large subunit ribosomal protein L24
MSIARIKKGDVVIVISGDSAGKTGKVLRMMPSKGMAVVEGVNMIRKAIRRSEQNPNGGFVDKEAPIRLCKLMPFDAEAKKGVRIKRVREGDKWVRKSQATGKTLE